jgi:hypothetical protein
MPDFRNINPIVFFYEQDYDLFFNQNRFSTQQGLDLNLINALSGLKDETILNYSNIFLSKKLPINDVVYLPDRESSGFVFSTYFGLSSLSGTNFNTRYLTISANPGLSAGLTFSKNLSNIESTYFAFQAIDGLECRITSINDDLSKNLTVDLKSFNCSFTVESPAVTANGLDIFEYSLDTYGNLKLFFRGKDNFYIIRQVGAYLSAVEATTTTSLSTDIFTTTYNYDEPINFKNDFIYYDKSKLNDFKLNLSKSINNISQNHVLFYNYQSKSNFISGASVNTDFFKTKNVLSNNYFVNDKLPFDTNDFVQRDYTTILSKQNSETYEGNLQFNYNFYTKEYLFPPDKATKFTLPETLYPYSVINVDNSNLINAGSYGGLSPVYSDKLVKNLNPNLNAVNYNEANGIYLYTWLYTDTNQLTSYWLDRYYFPKKTSLNVAYSGSNNQIFNYTSELSSFLDTNYPADNFQYYDIRSSLTLEPSASYIYSRIGSNYINKVVDTYAKSLTGFEALDKSNVSLGNVSNLTFDGSSYGAFNLQSDENNSFTLSFDINSNNKNNINSNLIVGNNFDEGISIYKGGYNNIFTPVYMINTLSSVELFNLDNTKSFSLDVGSYVGAPVIVLDIINTGFDHLLKIFYVRTDTNVPGFLDFSINNKIFNKYEFNSLDNKFRSGNRINLFGKVYKDNNYIYYLVKDNINSNPARVYIFDYINNSAVNVATLGAAAQKNFINSLVSYDENIASTTALSGFDGKLLDEFIGVSKLYNTVYFRNLSSVASPSTSTQYPTLCTLGGGIFDVEVYGDKFYIQTNGSINSYDKYKTLYNTYTWNVSAVSGIKIDFINDNFKTKLISYTADAAGKIIIDRYDLETTELENTFNTGITVDPVFFKEFQYPVRARYTTFYGIGIVNNSYVSGGFENNYTYSTPIIGSLTALPINAILAGISDNANITNSSLSGFVDCFGVPIPSDLSFDIYQNNTLVQTITGDSKSTSLTFTFNNISRNLPYSLVCSRTLNETIVVRMGVTLNGGTFYNGSFRNVVVGKNFQEPASFNQGFANAFFALVENSLTDQYGYVQYANALSLDENYNLISPTEYYNPVNFNGVTNQNPYNLFYHNQTPPQLTLTANPALTTFQPVLITFNSEIDPPFSNSELLSGAPFQVPTNLSTINKVNKFSDGDIISRIDLFSGNNYLNKQTKIVPFNIQNNSQIVLSFDVNEGFLRVYNNAELIKNIPLSGDTFYTSYFLNNDFGVGAPLINNKPYNSNNVNYSQLGKNYAINNFVVYDRPLNVDEVKFNYLKNEKIDTLNFDVTTGTRNDLDTVTSFNKMIIPGRKNNDVLIYIKNAYLNEAGRAQLISQLTQKVRNILPLNTSKIEFQFIDYESN